jgi:hypothetical protein
MSSLADGGRCRPTAPYSNGDLDVANRDKLAEGPRGADSATHVFVEPVDRALPGQIGRGFLIPFRRRVASEAMYGTGVNIVVVRNVRRVQGLVVSRPRRCQARVELPPGQSDGRTTINTRASNLSAQKRRGRARNPDGASGPFPLYRDRVF